VRIIPFCRLSHAPPQINNVFSVLNLTSSRTDTALAAANSANARALQAEGALAVNIANVSSGLAVETLRATGAEALITGNVAQLSTGLASEQSRTLSSNTQLSSALAQTQLSLANSNGNLLATQASLAAATSTLTQVQATLASTQTSATVTRDVLTQTQSSLAQASLLLSSVQTNSSVILSRLDAIAACAARGLFADAQGNCITANAATATTTGGCPANNSGLNVAPLCMPGFSPQSSATSGCTSGSAAFPTTFTCQGAAGLWNGLFFMLSGWRKTATRSLVQRALQLSQIQTPTHPDIYVYIYIYIYIYMHV
jgi:hypothetical protein